MALITKTDPVGLDIVIDKFQRFLFSRLGFSNWDSYPRIYSNVEHDSEVKNSRRLIPEHFSENDDDYIEIFTDDNADISTFFHASPRRTHSDMVGFVDVSWIVQVQLDKLFPNITHRADEEFVNAVEQASLNFSGYDRFKHVETVFTINDVYQEWVKDDVKIDDLQPFFVARFKYEAKYNRC